MKVILLGYFTRDMFCSRCSLQCFEAALRNKKVSRSKEEEEMFNYNFLKEVFVT